MNKKSSRSWSDSIVIHDLATYLLDALSGELSDDDITVARAFALAVLTDLEITGDLEAVGDTAHDEV